MQILLISKGRETHERKGLTDAISRLANGFREPSRPINFVGLFSGRHAISLPQGKCHVVYIARTPP